MRQTAMAAVCLAAGVAGAASAQTAPTQVTITAKAPAVIHKADRTIYDLSQNPQATTATVGDILDTLPSVAVDPAGNVNVRGTAAQILIDGKPSAALRGDNLAGALQTLPAGTIARIEVITAPGPEFHSDAAVIINLITRKAGVRPNVEVIAGMGPQGRYSGTVSASATLGPWKLSGHASLIQDIRQNRAQETRALFNPNGSVASHLASSGGIFIPYGAVSAGASATDTIDDHNSLTLEADADMRRRPRTGHTRFITTNATGIADMTTNDQARQVFNDASLSAIYIHKGQRDGETFTLQERHEEDDNLSDDRLRNIYAAPFAPDEVYRHRRTNRELQDALTGDYVLPLGKDEVFKAGFDIEADRDQRLNFDSVFDLATGNDRFAVNQDLTAAYVDYQHPLGRWVWDGGLRLEHQRTRLWPSVTVLSDTQWSPSLSLSRDLDDRTNLHLSYDRHIRRPSPDELNPLPWIGPLDTFIGNPRLRPAHIDAVEAGYAYTTRPLSVSATLYRRTLTGDFVNYSYYVSPSDPGLVTSVENAGRTTTLGLDASLDVQATKQWGYSLASDLSHVHQSGIGGPARSLMTQVSRLAIRFDPDAADDLQLRLAVNGRTLLIDGTQGGHSQVNLSYSHTVSKRLKLVLNANDIAAGNRTVTHRVTPQLSDDTTVVIPGRLVYLGLHYKLGD